MRPPTLPAAALACLTLVSSGPSTAAAHDLDTRVLQTSGMPVTHAPIAGHDANTAPDRLGHAAFLIACGVIGVYLLRKANHGRDLPGKTRATLDRPAQRGAQGGVPRGNPPQARPMQGSHEGRLRAS